MPVSSNLGLRMKNNYEKISQTKLTRHIPVAIRIDGKAFHTFTKGFKKPFDEILMNSMQNTMHYLCKNIQGCVFGYTQSDEITLILIDYQNLDTAAWFDYEVQKICSVSASMATMAFNKFFTTNALCEINESHSSMAPQSIALQEKNALYNDALRKAMQKGAMFDARCFNIPKEEVCNLIYWRQLDATRNSIQMVAQSNFSQKQLEGKSCNELQDMLLLEKNIDWNNYSASCKHGTACIKEHMTWFIDRNMPILIGENRDYVNNCILYKE